MKNPRRIRADHTAVLATGLAISALLWLAPATAAAQAPGPVLVVGDSLGVGTEPYLREELGGAELTVDAKTSRPSSAGVEVLRSAIAPAHEVVVFDLGTNDDPGNPGGLTASLEAARQIAGDRCLVVATINRPPLNGVSDDGLNAAVTDFAAASGAQVADWRAVASRPGVLQADGVHATPTGYAARALVVADAIRSCGAPAGLGGGGSPQTRPPKLVPAPDAPELGPGLAVLAAPVLAIAERTASTLGFARAVSAAAARALRSALRVGVRLVRRIGDQPPDP